MSGDQPQMRLGPCLVSEGEVRETVARLAREISDDYRDLVTEEQPLLLVGILKGAVVFMSDLVRALSVPVSLDFMAVSSYGDSTSSSGVVRILHDLDTPLEDRHVLLVEDIVDTGLTLKYLREHFSARSPASLGVVALLDKPERRTVDVPVEYVGRAIPDRFVVGYGLDWNQRHRGLPCVKMVEEVADEEVDA